MTERAGTSITGPIDRAEALERLRRAGCRMTPARTALLDDVLSRTGRCTADDLIHTHPELDEATVYRTLAQFEQVGIVHHVHLGHGPATYAPGAAASVPLVCEVCHRVVDLAGEDLAPLRRIAERHGMELALGHFALSGRCAACVRSDSDQRTSSDAAS